MRKWIIAVLLTAPITAHTGVIEKPDADYWVTSDTIDQRTCPSIECGVVGRLRFRAKASVFEVKDGWARVSRYYGVSCENGVCPFVDEGNAACTADNGFVDGKFAEWVPLEHLSQERPADPAAGATGTAALVAKSDDYRLHKDAFVEAAEKLIGEGRCTAADFRENGGWVKSSKHRNQPIYFMYCGGSTRANRLYLNARTGRIFK